MSLFYVGRSFIISSVANRLIIIQIYRQFSALFLFAIFCISRKGIQAIPGTNTNVPLWILGSSLFGAQLAAMLGLPYAFASHFAPDHLMQAMENYRDTFKPSNQLQKPYVLAGVNVIAAETDEEVHYLFTSLQQRFADMARGARGYMKPPIDDIEAYWSGPEKIQAQRMLACSFVGSPKSLRTQLKDFMQETGADELMVATAVYDHKARLKSYELLACI